MNGKRQALYSEDIEKRLNSDHPFENRKEIKEKTILNKKDIMLLYNCGSEKALNILKFMFQTGFGNRIGKQYYITPEAHRKFLEFYAGKEVII